jgi:hypothetical protein
VTPAELDALARGDRFKLPGNEVVVFVLRGDHLVQYERGFPYDRIGPFFLDVTKMLDARVRRTTEWPRRAPRPSW